MKPLRRAYRIERASDGAGPFWTGVWDNMGWHEKNPRQMPGPCSEARHKRGPRYVGIDYKRLEGEWRYAFDSLTSLAHWCSPIALNIAHRAGHVVRVVGVPWDDHTWLTDQIVYRWRAATVLRELSPLDVPVELEARKLRRLAA